MSVSYHSDRMVPSECSGMIKNFLLTFCLTAFISTGFCMQNNTAREYKLDNGLKVVVKSDHRAPVVVTQMWYRVGGADEHSGMTGLSHALEHMMFLGTPTMPGDQFSKIIGSLGGYENAFTSEDQTVYYEEIGKQHLETCLAMEADRMQNLIFDPAEVRRELEVIKEERRLRVEDDPQSLLSERFLAAANVGGAYHHPVIGWMADINQMTLEDLKDWYHTWYAPNQATLIVVGDVNPDDVFVLAKKYFGDIPSAKEKPIKKKPILDSIGKRSVEVHAKANLPFVMIGYDVPTFANQDKENVENIYALMVLQSVLDGGLSARFETELVRKQEKVAEISTHYDPYQRYQTQFLVAFTPAEAVKTERALQAVEEEINKIKEKVVSTKELQRAKMNLISGFVYDRDSIRAQAMQLGQLATLGLSANFLDTFETRIQAVSAKQVKSVANEFLTSKRQTMGQLIPETKN